MELRAFIVLIFLRRRMCECVVHFSVLKCDCEFCGARKSSISVNVTGNEGNVKENWRRKRVPAFDLNSVKNHNSSRTKGGKQNAEENNSETVWRCISLHNSLDCG